MKYDEMISQACASMGGKFMSRSMIKTYLTKNFGYVDSAMSKNFLKKALGKFERKGDSFRVSKAMKDKAAGAGKMKAQKDKAAARKKTVVEKRRASASAKKEKLAEKKAAILVKKQAKKEKLAAKKAAAAQKKKAAQQKRALKKASKKATKKTVKKTVKKAVKKTAAKK